MTNDIEKVLRNNDELNRQCALFQAMFDATINRIFIFDSEIRYLYVNSAGAKALGLGLPEILGKTWLEVGNAAEVIEPLVADIKKVFKTGWSVRGETRLGMNGEARFFVHNLTPIRDQAGKGKVSSVLTTLSDITERKIIEEELNYQRTLLQTVSESTPEYLYILDRELNYVFVSPSVIKLLSLEPEDLLEMNWKNLTFPATVMEPLEAKINQVFATGKTFYAESQFLVGGEKRYYEDVLTPVPTKLDQVEFILVSARDVTKRKWYEEALKETTLIAEKHASELDYIIRSITDGLILFDHNGAITQMNEMASEVFGYSVGDYLFGEDGVQVNIFLPDGRELKPEETLVYRAMNGLTFRDHGIGIPEENITKIFDPFFTTKKKGNGLGLSTSYTIVRKHSGYLEVESSPLSGTAFYIFLPISKVVSAVQELQREVAAYKEAKILLMDDEDTIRNVGGEMLRHFGYRVTLARDGKEAIKLFQTAQETGEQFDALIFDLTIPGGMGGIQAMSIMREIDPEVKVIISSGYANDPVMSDFKKYGFSGVVTKPYKFDELIEVLNQVIGNKQ